LENYK
jgi:hypothetical protein